MEAGAECGRAKLTDINRRTSTSAAEEKTQRKTGVNFVNHLWCSDPPGARADRICDVEVSEYGDRHMADLFQIHGIRRARPTDRVSKISTEPAPKHSASTQSNAIP